MNQTVESAIKIRLVWSERRGLLGLFKLLHLCAQRRNRLLRSLKRTERVSQLACSLFQQGFGLGVHANVGVR